MTPTELADKLASESDSSEIAALLDANCLVDNSELAEAIKDICLDSWTLDPTRSVSAANALSILARTFPHPLIDALSAWCNGISAMVAGQLRSAVSRLDDARSRFAMLGNLHYAALTQVAKLFPLAMLGRYDEAITDGLWARKILIESSDHLAAGRVEHNLGNIYQLNGRYADAEEILRAAQQRFTNGEHIKTFVQITNSIAFVLSYRYKFAEAEAMYFEALCLAEKHDLRVTKAEIESNLGYFALFQGRYDQALRHLERARSDYETIGMPHQSAMAELEMADAYFDLNLTPEALEIYDRVITVFAASGAALPHARALTNRARIGFAAGQKDDAIASLQQARSLFSSINCSMGTASTYLAEAQFLSIECRYADALSVLSAAEMPVFATGVKGIELSADVLRAEALRATASTAEARTLFDETLSAAEKHQIPQIAVQCLISLGLIAASSGDTGTAERYHLRAIELIEQIRSPLPSEEFRSAFFGDKLTPYYELVKLCLADDGRIDEALDYVERSRSRTLVESIDRAGSGERTMGANDIDDRILVLRAELNWLYNQIYLQTNERTDEGQSQLKEWQAHSRENEKQIAELSRQKQIQNAEAVDAVTVSVVDELRASLTGAVFVEYVEIDGELCSFVVSLNSKTVFHRHGDMANVEELVKYLYFQLDTLKSQPDSLSSHLYDLTLRTRQILNELYVTLLRPIERHIGLRRLIIAPHRSLFYLPFHALFDGFEYLIESREVSYVPSGTTLCGLRRRQSRELSNGLFIGIRDEAIPNVGREIQTLSAMMPSSVLMDGEATFETIKASSAGRDIMHIASHAHFRDDNPLFSSIRLTEGWLTVRDIQSVKLDPELIVLSACETGINRIADGGELLGLTRGFLAAGARSLVMSLWRVDDEVTTALMTAFYNQIAAGSSPAKALRMAQFEIMKTNPHPFYWSPFFLMGD